AGILGALNVGRLRRHILLDQNRRAFHVLLHVVFLVLDDFGLQPSSASAAAGRRRLRWCGSADRDLLNLAVRPVEAALLRSSFFFTFEADDRGLNPLVLTKLGLPLLYRLLERGHTLLRRRIRLRLRGSR